MLRTSTAALVAALVLAVAACGGKSSTPPASPTGGSGDTMPAGDGTTGGSDGATGDVTTPDGTEPVSADHVCCQSFGYGAQMAECCQTYAWTSADECKAPAGFVGGGKRVVANDKCGS